ncbi:MULTISPECIES: DnaT-like ssDNA-binding domain-containing protein [unclassified Thiocapsa]|uniref:DnaT-like ssDNA-binding domain-containing protein n=1 Tax=unclassified Thiocapsa TaxID=2641286 RepID=UPI0035B000E6
MSRAARDWAWDCRGLTLAQRLVLLALAEYADERGEQCFPSLALLEWMTELSRRGITKALGGLDGTLIERARGGPGRATHYRLLLSASQQDQGCQWNRDPSALSGRREQRALGNTVPMGREPGSVGREQSSSLIGNTVPPDRYMNRHGTVSEPSVLFGDDASAPERPGIRGGGRTPIPPDWQPSQRVFDWAAKHGMTRTWAAAQVDEFVVYWTDTGTQRDSWDATFINRLRTLQASDATRQDHEPEPRLADKDYSVGATPLDQIPWLIPDPLG